ncbi:hypothetical protein CDD81_535 [Ophiocordyceps australis]|uniref:PWI domain-containing protein n=1 Tax=Ophiocordyceps australis TaxID=1399860 RepID=A0A2C5YEW0_9HYPO|nr:hypothetical protein CDD81_535 [Ophiocordyceps australis]
MAYNPYGGNAYNNAPPGYGGYGGAAPPPGMGAAPGLAAPPGMPMAPGMPGPPGVPQPAAQQMNRPTGLPAGFQPPANMPNINFNAPVIRLGTGVPTTATRGDASSAPSGGRPGLGGERGTDQGRDRGRDLSSMPMPLSMDEKLRTLIIYNIPEGVGGDIGIQKLCNALGRLRRWENMSTLWPGNDKKLGFATFDDDDSISIALKLLGEEDFQVPIRPSEATCNPPADKSFDGIDKTRLLVSFDTDTIEHQNSLAEQQAADGEFQDRLLTARAALKQVQYDMFFPPIASSMDAEGDARMAAGDAPQSNVEVVNISIAQEDELADIPAEMREIVAKEIAAFRERSTQRDIERLRREEEIEARHRQQNGASRSSFLNVNNVPLGPRATTSGFAPGGSRRLNGIDEGAPAGSSGDAETEDEDIYRREVERREEEETKRFLEMERKWLNRERARQQALEREMDRERTQDELFQKQREEQHGRDKAWDDDAEAARKSHLFYRDHATWARQRLADRQQEEMRDEADRRDEEEEKRRAHAAQERARGQADAFLDQAEREMTQRPSAPAPQPFKLSLGAAAQRAQASRAMPQRRTIADIEGLLDDEEAEPSVRRPLVPIQMDAAAGGSGMSEEEISQAVRALAQGIPSDKEKLWAMEVKWDYMDESIIRDRLRPFVEKKIVEYLGVQEEMLVATIEDHIRKHGTAAALVEELEGALDDEAEDLVKKLWRMVVFFTECEKCSLPA